MFPSKWFSLEAGLEERPDFPASLSPPLTLQFIRKSDWLHAISWSLICLLFSLSTLSGVPSSLGLLQRCLNVSHLAWPCGHADCWKSQALRCHRRLKNLSWFQLPLGRPVWKTVQPPSLQPPSAPTAPHPGLQPTSATHRPPKHQLPAPSTLWPPSYWGLCASPSHHIFHLPNFLLILQGPVETSLLPESLPQSFSLCCPPPSRASLSSVLPKILKLLPLISLFFTEIILVTIDSVQMPQYTAQSFAQGTM